MSTTENYLGKEKDFEGQTLVQHLVECLCHIQEEAIFPRLLDIARYSLENQTG